MSGLDDKPNTTAAQAIRLNLGATPTAAPRILPLADPATKSAAPATILSIPKMPDVAPKILQALPVAVPTVGPTPNGAEDSSARVNGMYNQFIQSLNHHLDTYNPIGRL